MTSLPEVIRSTGPLPRHGTKRRYKAPLNCSCVACTARWGAQDNTYEVRWPASRLEAFVGLDRLRLWADEPTIEAWRAEGVSDRDADAFAIKLGAMADEIWPGYTSAGLDYHEVTKESDAHVQD